MGVQGRNASLQYRACCLFVRNEIRSCEIGGNKEKGRGRAPSTVHALACMFIQRKQGRDRAGTDSRTGQSKTRQKRLAGTKRINSFKGSGDDK